MPRPLRTSLRLLAGSFADLANFAPLAGLVLVCLALEWVRGGREQAAPEGEHSPARSRTSSTARMSPSHELSMVEHHGDDVLGAFRHVSGWN
jgi:hypothetical protein